MTIQAGRAPGRIDQSAQAPPTYAEGLGGKPLRLAGVEHRERLDA
jgi:hypothetical protein